MGNQEARLALASADERLQKAESRLLGLSGVDIEHSQRLAELERSNGVWRDAEKTMEQHHQQTLELGKACFRAYLEEEHKK